MFSHKNNRNCNYLKNVTSDDINTHKGDRDELY